MYPRTRKAQTPEDFPVKSPKVPFTSDCNHMLTLKTLSKKLNTRVLTEKPHILN